MTLRYTYSELFLTKFSLSEFSSQESSLSDSSEEMPISLKVHSETIFVNWKPFKNDEKCF